ncbi:MAG: MASE3 domain-containing protein, partial [Candidatus Heimdallarchaeaceae archaeon]
MKTTLNIYKRDFFNYLLVFVATVSVITGLFFMSNFNFLLFHIFVEVTIIITAIFIFIISWYGRKFLSTDFLLILGISKIFVALVEFLHVVSYKEMNIIQGYDANLPTSLWILARYLDALTFVLIFVITKKKINVLNIMFGYLIITGTMIYLIFARVFPTCYIEGKGLTLFKIISEYIISFLFIVTCYLIYKFRIFTPKIRRLIIFSLIFNTIGEIFFTFYVKHVQKLIFINVGVYVGSMNFFQIIDPHKAREFIIINEP